MSDDTPRAVEPIIARFDGKCGACGMTIIAGERIVPETDAVRDGLGNVITEVTRWWEHEVCPTPRGSTTCPRCFLERPCPCEDDQ